MEDFDKKTKAYALKNAIHYKGKANPGAVISGLFAEGIKKDEVKKYAKEINEIVNSVNKLSPAEQEKEYEKLKKLVSERETREGLEELPRVPKTGVIMRFRPAPSGPLHIGHIISNMISSLYVKNYGGKFFVIVDDTSPETTRAEAYKNIKRDCDWIFGNVTEYINSSDRMKLYYEYAEKLIKKNFAYVCTCPSDEFKKIAELKMNCPCRNNSLKENIYRWQNMFDKKKGYKAGEAVLRFKSTLGMQDPNPAMRDFPLARINETEHSKQKKKYRVWPLMNLVVAIDDIELGMTHIIRGKDHRDNAKRQKMIFDIFKKKYPWTYFMGRIKFKDVVLSKRKLNAMIGSGEFSGEEDEKIPTIASLRKRGYKPEAFAKFAEQRGLTEVDKVINSEDFFRILDSFNK